MSPAGKNKARMFARVTVVLFIAALLYTGLTLQDRAQFAAGLDRLEQEELRAYLSQAFPADLMPADPNRAPDTAGIERRIAAFNEAHAQPDSDHNRLIFELVRLGPVEVQSSLPAPIVAVSSSLPGRASDASARIHVSAPGWFNSTRAIGVSAFFLAGLLLSGFMPQPVPINAYPIARDMATVFDRKVSANQNWGAYRLTHLGGGGTLPGLSDNAAAVCNDEHARLVTFDAIHQTYEPLRKRILGALPDPSVREGFALAMESGFKAGRHQIQANAPTVSSEHSDLEQFRAFVQSEVLGFALITLNDRVACAELAKVSVSQVTIEPPAAWLIGGYELYYPRDLLFRLIGEIQSGLISATGRPHDSVHVFSDSKSSFISIDFRLNGASLTADDWKRIGAYASKPFAGGLSRLAALLQGTGRFQVLDANGGVDITERKRITERTPAGLTNRVQFRKVRPEELRSVRQQIKGKLPSDG